MRILVTGGAGFMGSAFIRHLIQQTEHQLLNVDKLTYASDTRSLATIADSERYSFAQADICDPHAIPKLILEFAPQTIVHLAAESHVDRSIDAPAPCIQTNINGTQNLLQAAQHFWSRQKPSAQKTFRFHHISTDEVYGDLADHNLTAFTTSHPYNPSSPYSASKAAADHLVHAWHRTYQLPTTITHCTNNYGPYQFPEKLIPNSILRALAGKDLLLFGDGQQSREWLHVDDTAQALTAILQHSTPGQRYHLGSNTRVTNHNLIQQICAELETLPPHLPTTPHLQQCSQRIRHVTDRPGHDRAYALDSRASQIALHWQPQIPLAEGLRHTIHWYLQNTDWWQPLIQTNNALQRQGTIA